MKPHVYSKTCVFKSVEDIKDKHVTIMGLGLNGGGEAAVRFFLKKGAYVLVTDMTTREQLTETVDRIAADKTLDTSRLSYCLGEHRIEDFENADCVIKNPGVKYDGNKFLAAARAIETDLSIFLRFTNCPIIAVTGSKGKSSTASAIYYGLKKADFNAFLGGNITVSPLTFFDSVSQNTPVVIEFSSWQLADLRGRGVLKPHIAIITKIVPDHQNWYGNMEDYIADKRLIYAEQSKGDYSIFDNEGDEDGTGPDSSKYDDKFDTSTWENLFTSESKAIVVRYGKSPLKCGAWLESERKNNEYLNSGFCGKVLLPGMKNPETILKGISVPGEHMKTNVLNAALVLFLMGVPSERICDICGSWAGIEHRLQFFHEWKVFGQENEKVRFYNDSCATVPEATVTATQSFDKSVILAAGGTDKGLDLTPLVKVLTSKGEPDKTDENGIIPVKDIYFLSGTATDKITPSLDAAGIKYNGPFNSLDELLAHAKKNLETETQSDEKSGVGGKSCADENKKSRQEVFVFSPGATSFGMFANEFDRGNKFMAAVKAMF